MLKNNLHALVLAEYSAGEITWREAAERLGLDDFESFEKALKGAGLSLYEPGAEESEKKLAALDALLDQGL